MLENTLEVLEDHAPGLARPILHAELLMPWDIEDRYGMAGGNWHHAELSVEQMLFLRPFHRRRAIRKPPARPLACRRRQPSGRRRLGRRGLERRGPHPGGPRHDHDPRLHYPSPCARRRSTRAPRPRTA